MSGKPPWGLWCGGSCAGHFDTRVAAINYFGRVFRNRGRAMVLHRVSGEEWDFGPGLAGPWIWSKLRDTWPKKGDTGGEAA